MPKESAGLLMYRPGAEVRVLLCHPGGPFWRHKDLGAWTIPKGELEPGEVPLIAARREFAEEISVEPRGPFHALTPIRQKGGKKVIAWAFAGDCDPAAIRSNTFKLEWPPRSGIEAEFPEIDRAELFALPEARRRIIPAQVPLLDELATFLAAAT